MCAARVGRPAGTSPYPVVQRVLAVLRTDRRVTAAQVAAEAECARITAKQWLDALTAASVVVKGQRPYSSKAGKRPAEYWRARAWGGTNDL